jgi:hypothetical protein
MKADVLVDSHRCCCKVTTTTYRNGGTSRPLEMVCAQSALITTEHSMPLLEALEELRRANVYHLQPNCTKWLLIPVATRTM